MPVIPALGGWEQEDSLGFLAGQPSQSGALQGQQVIFCQK